MFKLTKRELVDYSQETGFQKDSLEKVFRLIGVLKFLEEQTIFSALKLKGGTALQLAIFNFKRLSVDIDFDYHSNDDKEVIQQKRSDIKDILIRFMQSEQYSLSSHSKFPYSLDSYIFSYTNLAGNPDNIKIDINYTNRRHILEPALIQLKHPLFSNLRVQMLSELELYATKINALLTRTLPRDLYDTYLIVNENKVKKEDYELLRKMIVFYLVLSNSNLGINELLIEAKYKISNLSFFTVKKTLIPLLSKNEKFDIRETTLMVNKFLDDLFQLEPKELEFIEKANKQEYDINLLFDEEKAKNLKDHPRILWLVMKKVF